MKISPRIYLLSKFPNARKRSGEEIMISCPFHKESKPSMSVALETGVYHCFGCKKKGNFVSLYKFLENITWNEASNRCGTIQRNNYDRVRVKKTFKLPDDLISSNNVLPVYLKNRGFTVEDLALFDVSWRISDYSIFFPIYDENKNLISYVTRRPTGKSNYYYPEDSPHMDYLYGEWLKLRDKVFIVEGAFDCISVNRCGYSSLSTFTTSFTIEQLNRMKRFIVEGRCKEYVVCYDADASDRGDELEFMLSSMGCKVNQLKLKYGDPGDKSKEQMTEVMNEFLERSLDLLEQT